MHRTSEVTRVVLLLRCTPILLAVVRLIFFWATIPLTGCKHFADRCQRTADVSILLTGVSETIANKIGHVQNLPTNLYPRPAPGKRDNSNVCLKDEPFYLRRTTCREISQTRLNLHFFQQMRDVPAYTYSSCDCPHVHIVYIRTSGCSYKYI